MGGIRRENTCFGTLVDRCSDGARRDASGSLVFVSQSVFFFGARLLLGYLFKVECVSAERPELRLELGTGVVYIGEASNYIGKGKKQSSQSNTPRILLCMKSLVIVVIFLPLID